MQRLSNNINPKVLNYIRPRQLERLVWIETALKRGEEISLSEFCKYFDVSQPTFTHDLNRYSELVAIFGGESERVKGWLKIIRWPDQGPVGTMSHLQWQKIIRPNSLVHITTPVVAIEQPDVCRAVSDAILGRLVIQASYNSTTSGLHQIKVSPHTLIEAAGRHHIRAYDHFANSYKDYVLARMSDAEVVENVQYVSSEQDCDWNEIVKVELSINPKLSKEKQLAIAHGFGMKTPNEKINLSCRRCLVNYQLLSIGIRPDNFENYLEVSVDLY